MPPVFLSYVVLNTVCVVLIILVIMSVYFTILYIWMLSLHRSVCITSRAVEAEEGLQSPGAGMTGSCEVPDIDAGDLQSSVKAANVINH